MAAFDLPVIFEHRPAPVSTHHQRVGQWTLTVSRDRFSGVTSCQLRARDMTVARGAISFRFGAGVATYGAIYRVDGGPPVSWRANAMALATRGALPDNESLSNPSGGVVAVPIAALWGGQAIRIRVAAANEPRRFKLDDLPAALRAAEASDCGADFVVEGAG